MKKGIIVAFVLVIGFIALLPSFIGIYLDDRATYYLNHRHYKEAIVYYNKVIALNDKYFILLERDDSFYYWFIGEACSGLKEHETAINYYKKALGLIEKISDKIGRAHV